MDTYKEIEKFDNEIHRIICRLRELYRHPPLDKNTQEEIHQEVISLLEQALKFLSNNNLLDSWQKDHIKEAIQCINIKWLFLALTNIQLSLVSENEISPDNKYSTDVTNLTYKELLEEIAKLKY